MLGPMCDYARVIISGRQEVRSASRYDSPPIPSHSATSMTGSISIFAGSNAPNGLGCPFLPHAMKLASSTGEVGVGDGRLDANNKCFPARYSIPKRS